MLRGYTFFQRSRGFNFWALDVAIEKCRKEGIVNSISTHFAIWGIYDVLVVLDGNNESAVHEAILQIYRNACESQNNRSFISDSCTFVAVNAAAVETWPRRATVLAIDTHLGYEDLVQKRLSRLPSVRVADVILGDHDVIALVDHALSQEAYLEFVSNTVNTIEGIEKTHTMFSFTKPQENGRR